MKNIKELIETKANEYFEKHADEFYTSTLEKQNLLAAFAAGFAEGVSVTVELIDELMEEEIENGILKEDNEE